MNKDFYELLEIMSSNKYSDQLASSLSFDFDSIQFDPSEKGIKEFTENVLKCATKISINVTLEILKDYHNWLSTNEES